MPLRKFVDEAGHEDWTLVVLNSERPDQVSGLVRKTFENEHVAVDTDLDTTVPADTVALIDGDEVVTTSTLERLREMVLFVNSDIYTTGTRGLEELVVPDVVLELSDTAFRLWGFPVSDTQKLVLITMSRYVEQLAFERGVGTLRAAFQRLSRLDSEPGTRRVYERLADTELEVHAYGIPDSRPPDLTIQTHHGRNHDYRRMWVVTFCPPDDGRHVALLAHERVANLWDGFWTFDTETVRAINQHMATQL
jgi:hypothetical protein